MIDPPGYNDVADDIIYTFIIRYKNYLLYEELSPENRSYNKIEQTMFVIKALKVDNRFKDRLMYWRRHLTTSELTWYVREAPNN